MATWQEAMRNKIALNTGVLSVDIRNGEFNNLDSQQAGFIIGDASGKDYVVGNPDTNQARYQLTEEQVEPALVELDIVDSDWV